MDSPKPVSASGIGHANVRTRLTGLYGDTFEFAMRNGRAGGEISVSLPYVASSSAEKTP